MKNVMKKSDCTCIYLAIISRCLFLIFAVIADYLLWDHVASGVMIFDFQSSSKMLKLIFGTFVKWDAAHFLTIAREGYSTDMSFAFYPFYPQCIRILASILSYGISLKLDELYIVAAMIISTSSFFANVLILRKLLKSMNFSNSVIDTAALCFIFNPATIFFASSYSESFYCMLSWSALYSMNTSHLYLAIVLFLLSSFTRSNSIFLIEIIICHFVRFIILNQRSTVSRWQIIHTTIQYVGCIVACIVPTIVVNYYAHMVVCLRDESAFLCNGHFLFSYSAIQSHFWSVGFLKYYQIKQIPNFLLATPIICLAVDFLSSYARAVKRPEEYSAREAARCLRHLLLDGEAAYAIHTLTVLLVAVLITNVQISTRLLLSSCPLLYGHMANIVSSGSSGSVFAWGGSPKRRALLAFMAVYYIVGTILHVNFYPWT